MDLQCSKWHIGLKIEDFVLLTFILSKILPLLNLFEPPYPIYGLHSAVFALFHLYNHFVSPFMDLQCSSQKIGLKMDDFVFFYLHFTQNLALLATSRSSSTYLCLEKCIFGIVLFVKPFFLSIYGFIVFQMAHWPQN